MSKTKIEELVKMANQFKAEKEDRGRIDLREYRFIPKLKFNKTRERSDIYKKHSTEVG